MTLALLGIQATGAPLKERELFSLTKGQHPGEQGRHHESLPQNLTASSRLPFPA
jgi:hypothetical protein